MGKEFLPELDERGFMVHIADLKKSYQMTLAYWQERKRGLLEELQGKTNVFVHELKKRRNREERIRLREEYPALHEELHEIKKIINSLNYCINWLHTGKCPGTSRGIDRRSVYQRTVHMDPSIMERYMRPVNSRSATTLTEDERHRLKEVLEILSPREREVYELHYGQLYSYSEIAGLLNIHKGSVEKYVERAHAKVSAGWQGTLF